MAQNRASRRQAPQPGCSRAQVQEKAQRADNAQHGGHVGRADLHDAETGRDDATPQHRAMDAEEVFYVLDEEALLDAGVLVDAGQSLDVDEPMEADLAAETGDPDGGIHRQESWRRRSRRRPD